MHVGRAEAEPAGVAVEDRAEDTGRVEARQAEPLDVAASARPAPSSRCRRGSRSRRSAGTPRRRAASACLNASTRGRRRTLPRHARDPGGGRVHPLRPARPIDDRAGGGRRGGKGTRTRRVLRRGHDDHGRRGGAARCCARSRRVSASTRSSFSTVAPAYVDKTNATAIHAALRLDDDVPAFDVGGSQRSAVGALRLALDGAGTVLAVASDIRTGLPGSGDEATGGDAAAAVADRRGHGDTPVIAELVGQALVHRGVRRPVAHARESRGRRCGRSASARRKYVPLGERAWQPGAEGRRPRARAGRPGDRHRPARPRATRAVANRLGVAERSGSSTTSPRTVGNTGRRASAVLLTAALETATARPGRSRSSCWPTAPTCSCSARPTPSPTYRPAPDGRRPSGRRRAGRVRQVPRVARDAHGRAAPPPRAGPHLGVRRRAERGLEVRLRRAARSRRPARRSCRRARAGAGRCRWPTSPGTIVTFTFDRLAYSESPPIAFAVVDFDGGGRLPDRAHRHGRVRDRRRRARRDDVPQAVHVRRHPQLLLEGQVDSGEWLMGSHGIRDRVAIVGMGCTKFGEHFDRSADDLMVEAVDRDPRARPASRRTPSTPTGSAPRSGAAASRWPGRSSSRASPSPGSRTTAPPDPRRCAKPRTRSRAGAYDIAMAVGVEKVKDAGYQGLPATLPAARRHRPHAHRGGDVLAWSPPRTARSTA